jgi:hypothetical protein
VPQSSRKQAQHAAASKRGRNAFKGLVNAGAAIELDINDGIKKRRCFMLELDCVYQGVDISKRGRKPHRSCRIRNFTFTINQSLYVASCCNHPVPL